MAPYRAWPFLSDPRHPVLSAAWAVLVHGSLSVLVVLPLIARGERRALLAALAFTAGWALDLDHTVAAGSLDPRALEHLDGRPETHSLTFAAALALFALATTRRRALAWALFAVLAVHVLYDAAGGAERWLYPLARPTSVPWLSWALGTVVLLAISQRIASRL